MITYTIFKKEGCKREDQFIYTKAFAKKNTDKELYMTETVKYRRCHESYERKYSGYRGGNSRQYPLVGVPYA